MLHMLFLDHCTILFHIDLEQMKSNSLLKEGAIVIVDNVLCPGTRHSSVPFKDDFSRLLSNLILRSDGRERERASIQISISASSIKGCICDAWSSTVDELYVAAQLFDLFSNLDSVEIFTSKSNIHITYIHLYIYTSYIYTYIYISCLQIMYCV